MSGVAVLAESHISIHSWPEADYAALDIFMCGDAKPDACIPVLREAFKPKRIAVGEHLRGQGDVSALRRAELVMPGLVPGIHDFVAFQRHEDVDGRDQARP